MQLVLLIALGWLPSLAAWGGVSAEWVREPPLAPGMDQAGRLPQGAWTPMPGGAVNEGYVAQPYWFRVRVDAPAGVRAGYLVIDNPLLDAVSIRFVAGPERGRSVELGALRPFHEREVRSTAFRVPLQLDPGQQVELLVRVSTRTAMQLRFGFETPGNFQVAERGLLVLNGVLFGVMLAMAAYNLCLLSSTRDRTYLWYAGWVLAMGLFSASVVGTAYEHLWPDMPGWNVTSRPVLLALSVACAMMFARDFIGAANLHRGTGAGIRSLGIVAALWVAGSLFMPYQLAIKGAIAIALAAMVVAPAGAWLAWRRGSQAAGYYVLAWAFVVLGGTVLAAEKLGLVPSSVLTQHSSQLGAAIESVVLSFALAARLNAERQLREQAEREALQSQAEARRLGDLSVRDALTGLYNRRRLETQLAALDHDLRGSHNALTVMMVDIDHFKRLNDTHGHAAGDACICAVADALQKHARRDSDLAVRYGGEEFCLLLPGTGAYAAQQTAESLRAAIEALHVHHAGRTLRVSVSIGVASSEAAMPLQPDELLLMADEALYQAKAGGRNRAVCRMAVVA